MGRGPESRCVGHVYGLDGAMHGTIQTVQCLHLAAGVPDGGCLKSAAVVQCSVTVVNLGVQDFDLP